MRKNTNMRAGLATLGAMCLGWPGLVVAWEPGTYPAGGADFTVDAQDRNDVVSFWHGVYQASEGYQGRHGWSGNYTAADPYTNAEGSTAPAFVTDVQRRLNFFRALCQVPAVAHLNSGATVLIDACDPTNLYSPSSSPPLVAAVTKAAAAQRAAYMIIRTYGYSIGATIVPPLGDATAAISHTPLQANCVAWTTAAWNANHHGNLAFGYYGPAAVDSYLSENALNATGDSNLPVGHRRWVLYPPATDFATGDTPGAYDPATDTVRPPTNVLYVVPKAGEMAAVTPRFVAYPAAGYFPAALNSALWSLSYPGAGFDTAGVTMTTAAGVAVAVVIQARNGSFGDPCLVWQVPDAQAATTVAADTRYHITVSGITGCGVPGSHTYAVTLINPNSLTSDQCVFGPDSPQIPAPATYQICPPSHAEAIEVNCFRPLATAWTEGAEDSPTPAVIATTASSYVFRSTASFAGFGPISGAKSFRLTFPVWYDPRLNGVPGQSFELDRDLVPGAAATLTFKYRRGYMSSATSLVVESSCDGGVSWAQKGAAITGNATGVPDGAASNATIALDASALPLRLRFRLGVAPGMGFYADQSHNGFDYTTIPTGIFLDDITTTNCQWLGLLKTNTLAATATSFVLSSASAGITLTNNLALRLRMRTKLGNRWMPYGPMKALLLSAADLTVAPVFAPAGAAPDAGQAITITSESNSTIYYRLNGGAEQCATSPVGGLSVPVDGSTLTLTAYAKKVGKSDSPIATTSYTGSALVTWMNSYFPAVTDPNVVGPAADPDHDGQANALEFALGGDPAAAGGRARVYNLTSEAAPGGAPALLLTLAVRAGTPAFSAASAPAATQDGVTYTVQGATAPDSFTHPVVVVDPVTAGLPPAPAGYEYRTFKLDVAAGVPNKGFLRVRVTAGP
jgi:hypothetical protein